jgi:histidinol-phosphate aminotransferase
VSNFSELVPDSIRSLPAYVPGKFVKLAEAGGPRAVKLASNENPFGPSPLAIKAIEEAARGVHLYPDNDSMDLRQRLAEKHGLPPECVLLTAGSTSLLDLMSRTLLRPGLNAITSERSFIAYPIVVRATGAEFRTVQMKGDGYDLDAIADAVDENTRLILIANPNNPTGSIVDAPALDRFLDHLPDHVIVALDEAYYDFAQWIARERGLDYSHAEQYVKEQRNVVALRTFSKAQGLAAVRVGYGLGPAELMGYITRVRTAFALSTPAQAAALASLDDQAHYERTMRNNAEQLTWLLAQFRELGYSPVESWSNFIYCEVGEDASALSQRLQGEGVVIRPLSGSWGARTAIRVTVGTPEENLKFIEAFKRVTANPVAR